LVGIGLTAAAAIYGVPWLVAALGFSTVGITASSIAAWMMSLYGGTVATGSVVAVLQSIGAAGMGSVATAIVGAIGGIAGGTTAETVRRSINNSDEQKKLVEGLTVCLLSPCGGKLTVGRVASVLKVFTNKGIDAITDEEKAALDRCLRVMVVVSSADV